MKPDISVIIPMYNAKNYVQYTVDSLLSQTKEELEILLIDDCSTDGSAEFVQEHYTDDSRVRVIRQPENGGPGAARNTGIELASGKYVAFCDSDDQVKPDCYEKMYATAREYDADVVHASGCLISLMDKTPMDMMSVKDENWWACSMDQPAIEKISLINDPQEVLFEKWLNHGFHWAIWNKLIRRSLLTDNHIRFGKMPLAEDQEFCLNLLFRAKQYVTIPGFWYCYRQVANSTCRSSYSIHFLKRALTSEFEISRSIHDLSDIPLFRDHPEKLHIVAEKILDGLEITFVNPNLVALGMDTVLQNPDIIALFKKYMGDQTDWALKCFRDSHSGEIKTDDMLNVVNSPSILRSLVEKGIFMTLSQAKLKENT